MFKQTLLTGNAAGSSISRKRSRNEKEDEDEVEKGQVTPGEPGPSSTVACKFAFPPRPLC